VIEPNGQGRPDLIVRAGTVVTMDAEREVLGDTAIIVVGTQITELVPFDEAARRHPDVPVIGGSDALATPGYINAHQHLTGDRLVRSSIPDDIDSEQSIFGWAVPVHVAHTADDDELSATLSLVEAVGNGVTTTIEAGTVKHPERVAAAFLTVGARGTVGRWGWDVGDGPLAAPAGEVLAAAEELVGRYPPGGGLVEAWVTLVGHDLMSDELVAGASELARGRGTGLTFHISPHRGDRDSYLRRTGAAPLVHLDRLGALGPHVLLAHAVHVDADEVDAVLRARAAIACCPWAYLRLAQGITGAGRHLDCWRRGGRLALGCDAENASDAIDMLRAASLFVGLERDRSCDPTSITAADGLALATSAGAEAIGMAERIGSLEPGKQADIVVHDTSGPQWTPRGTDPVRHLVWASDGRSVSDVIIAGRVVVAGGRCVTVDLASLRTEATARRNALLRAAGHA
jgi:5-methylthioadenosine/S-adenosylhomocysteine deaminase